MENLRVTGMSIACVLLIYTAICRPQPCQAIGIHHEKYFQQYVHYTIDVALNYADNTLHTKEHLIYVNNSPDTLNQLHFHLYINKYRRHSLTFPEQTEDFGWIELHTVKENDSTHTGYTIDRTLMDLPLYTPLKPGDTTRLYFEFEVKLPPASGRYGYQGLHYDVGNWYVTPVVYDRFGWHRHQHIDNEFYQEWGDFEVTIRVPQDFRVGATGNLQNADEVLPMLEATGPEFLRTDYADSILIPWDFSAANVHDFAWTTDPSYELLQAEWDGITLNVLVLDYNVESWQSVTEWGIEALKYMCEKYGRYPYDQLTIADTYITAGGIEYPQIVMINDFIHPDFEPGEFRAVVIHEMAHNWFYGLLANNQLEHEWLDEGFTSYAEIKTMEHIFGVDGNMNPGERGWLFDSFGFDSDNRTRQAYGYLRLAKRGLIDDPIDLHADYLGNEGYLLQYSKMAHVLFMLEYALGDSVFDAGMLNYFKKWHFRHPYPGDFIAVMEETTNRDLDWFFDQWLKTNRTLDLAIDEMHSEKILTESGEKWQTRVRFAKRDPISMPVNFSVFYQDSRKDNYHIPMNAQYTYPGRKELPYWHFSRDWHDVRFTHETPIDYLTIDPEFKLLETNRLNNTSGWIPPMEWHFMRSQSVAPPLHKYIWEVWPLAFYNDVDNAKLGANIKGSYLNLDHRLYLNVWYKTAVNNIDFDFSYTNPIQWLGKLSEVELRLFTLDGRQGCHFELIHRLPSYRSPDITMRLGFANQLLFDDRYLTNIWSRGNINSLYLGWEFATSYRGWYPKDNLGLFMHTSFIESAFDYSQIYLKAAHNFWSRSSDMQLQIRMFAGYSTGDVPMQFLFNLGGDNGWGEFQHIFYRARGALPWPWKRNGNLYKSGGPDVKGYSLFGFDPVVYGKKALAANIDLTAGNPFDDFLPYVLRLINPHLFFDAGHVWNNQQLTFNSFKASAGVSLSWESLDVLDYILNLKSIRIDFPIWLSDPPSGQKSTEFRWLIRFDFE